MSSWQLAVAVGLAIASLGSATFPGILQSGFDGVFSFDTALIVSSSLSVFLAVATLGLALRGHRREMRRRRRRLWIAVIVTSALAVAVATPILVVGVLQVNAS